MPAFHSKVPVTQSLGNMAVCPVKGDSRGPAPKMAPSEDMDIIDEAIYSFRYFDIRNDSDRTLMYLTWYIQDCLQKLQRVSSKEDARKTLMNLANSNPVMPGSPSFPLSQMFLTPKNKSEEDQMRQYLQQLRQELGVRLIEKVYADGDKPSKWWMCFTKRKFMGKSLTSPGQNY